LSFAEVLWLSCVKDLADRIQTLPFEIDGVPKSARDHFAKERILHPII